MATNYTERKIEMICDEQSGQQFYRKTEIEMSTELKSKIDADPALAAQIADCAEALSAERDAEWLKRNYKPVSIEALMHNSDSEDEDNEEPKDRWNNPLQRHGEATKVQLIKDIIAELKETDKSDGSFKTGYKDTSVMGIANETGEDFSRNTLNKFGFAFVGWLTLKEHKLDGNGGNWCSGCFGSFWADIALTIPELDGVFYGCRISFNPTPKKENDAFFIISVCEKLKTRNPLKLLFQQSSACFPAYGPQIDYGREMADMLRAQKKAKKDEQIRMSDERRAQEAERQRVKAEKEAKLRAEHEERRKQEEERKAKFAAERALIEQQQDAERKAAFAARVAEVAKKDEAAKEQMRLAKEEKARVAEEAAKLKREQKEAERLAKFVNKKK